MKNISLTETYCIDVNSKEDIEIEKLHSKTHSNEISQTKEEKINENDKDLLLNDLKKRKYERNEYSEELKQNEVNSSQLNTKIMEDKSTESLNFSQKMYINQR